MAISLLSTSSLLQYASSSNLVSSAQTTQQPLLQNSALTTISSGRPASDSYTPSQSAFVQTVLEKAPSSINSIGTALNAAEQDGVQVVLWMKDQLTLSCAAQNASAIGTASESAASMSSGETSVAKFANDLAWLGSAIRANATSLSISSASDGYSASVGNADASSAQYNDTLSAETMLVTTPSVLARIPIPAITPSASPLPLSTHS